MSKVYVVVEDYYHSDLQGNPIHMTEVLRVYAHKMDAEKYAEHRGYSRGDDGFVDLDTDVEVWYPYADDFPQYQSLRIIAADVE